MQRPQLQMQYATAWLQVWQAGNTQNSCGELFACYRSMSWAETGLLVPCSMSRRCTSRVTRKRSHPCISLFPLRKVTSAWPLNKKALNAFHGELRYNIHQSFTKGGKKIAHAPPFPGAGSRLIRLLRWLLDVDFVKVFWLLK